MRLGSPVPSSKSWYHSRVRAFAPLQYAEGNDLRPDANRLCAFRGFRRF